MDGATDDMDHNIDILYESSDLLVINKPAGLMVHSDGKTDVYTLADWVAQQYPETKSIGEPLQIQGAKSGEQETIDRPGIVHRLDRDTSGVMIIAKNQQTFDWLKDQFQTRQVEKTYVAIVYGVMKKDADTIDRPIGRSASDFRKWSAQRGARGRMREAITRYEVVKRGAAHTFVRVFPQTGRTHQIRVHLKAINYPVVCDTLYAPKQPCSFDLKRHALHAESISFTTPQGETVCVEAPMPEDLTAAVAAL